jgi:Zn-dependent protease with chaperone function
MMRRLFLSMTLLALTFAAAAHAQFKLPGNVQVPKVDVPKVNDVVNKGQQLEQQRRKCERLRTLEVNPKEERAMGGAVAVNWVKQGGGLMVDAPGDLQKKPAAQRRSVALARTPKNDLTRYVTRVGLNLARQSGRRDLDWTFGVLESPGLNAVSAPGGFVFISKGLLAKLENESQLAGVLAHEIMHINRKHALRAYREVKANQCGTALMGQVAGDLGKAVFDKALSDASSGFIDFDDVRNVELFGKVADSLVDTLTSRGFAASDELDADVGAIELMTSVGYNPNEYLALLGRLPVGKDVFPLHPSPGERQTKGRAAIDGLKSNPLLAADHPFTGYAKVPLGAEVGTARR